MTAALIVAALVLLPGVVLAQPAPAQPGAPFPLSPPVEVTPPRAGAPPVVVNPVPPRSTIPSTPFPVPTPPPVPTGKLLDLEPSIRLIEEWTDNFRRSPRNPESNLRSTIAPGLRLLLDDPTVTGDIGYMPRGFYDTSTDGFGVHHRLVGGVGWQATPRFRLTAGGSFVNEDDPEAADRLDLRRGREEFTRLTGTLGADYAGSELTVRGYYRVSNFDGGDDSTTTHTLGANASRSLGRANTVTVGYEYLTSSTERDRAVAALGVRLAEDQSTNGHEFTGTFARELTSVITAGLTSGYAIRSQTGPGGDSDFSRWNVAIFGNYVLPGTIVLQANIGVAELRPSTGDSSLLITSDSHLTYFFGPAIVRLAAERGFSETFGEGQDFGVVETTGVSGSISYRVTPLFVVSASARYRINESTGQGGGVAGQKETTTRFGVQATYDILRWLNATLEYGHTDTSSSPGERSFSENRVRASLNALFD